jgi:hypothetical protein
MNRIEYCRKIILETSGVLGKIETPTLLLRGFFCDGSTHANCDIDCVSIFGDKWSNSVSTPENRNSKSQKTESSDLT